MTEKVLKCEFCGRVRIDGEWVHRNDVQPQVVGFCAACDEWWKWSAERKRRHEARRVDKRGRTGKLKQTGDPFRGFRGESE